MGWRMVQAPKQPTLPGSQAWMNLMRWMGCPTSGIWAMCPSRALSKEEDMSAKIPRPNAVPQIERLPLIIPAERLALLVHTKPHGSEGRVPVNNADCPYF